MSIVSSGQITITNLHDSPVLNAFITASQAVTQTFNSSSETWQPNYATTPQVLTLNLTRAGSATSILSGIVGSVSWRRRDGNTTTEITSTNTGQNQFVGGTGNSVLTTRTNVPTGSGSSRFEATGVWRDPATGLDVNFSATIDLTVIQLARASILAHIYAPNGSWFRNNLPSSLPVNCDMLKEGEVAASAKQIKWFTADTSVTATNSPGFDADGGLGWFLCTPTTTGRTTNVAPTVNNHTGQGVLTLSPNVVVNSLTVKCVMLDVPSGTKVQAFFTVNDMDDPILMVIESTAGVVMKNNQGSTTLTARLYQTGTEIDLTGTQYTYRWFKRDRDGVLLANFGGTGVAHKTGKSIPVTASEINVKGTYTCEIT